MKRYLRWILLTVGGLILLVLALPFVLPANIYKDQIIAQAKLATGRDLKIDGALKISFFPAFGVEVNQVHFANAPGLAATDMATMEQLFIGAELFPLLSGKIRVTHISLVKPVFNLEVDAKGQGNWVFEPAGATQPASTAPGTATGPRQLGDISFAEVTLTEGRVNYHDARSNASETVEHINASVALPSLDQALVFTGGLTWNNEAIKLVATLLQPRVFLEGGKSALTANIAADVMNASFDGSLDAGSATVAGKIDFKTLSARRLAAWIGIALPEVRGFGAMDLSGDMMSSGGKVSFSHARLRLDSMQGNGNLTLDSNGKKPMVKGDFTLDRLDLNQYTGKGARNAAASGGELAPWSESSVDFGPLALVDADFDLAVNALEVGELKIGRSALGIALNGGKLVATLKELELYGGQGKGTITLDGGKHQPMVVLALSVDGVQGEPFLTDAAGFKKLSGTGNIVVRVTASGSTQRALMKSLAGSATISFTDGAIKGINLAEIARSIQSALSGAAIGEAAKTDFAELSASFVISNGVAANNDLKLLNPFVRLNGAGTIDIGQQSLDYRVEPKAVRSIKGQGGNTDLSGIGIPFRIHGSWGHPKYEPDLSGVANSAIDAIIHGKSPTDLKNILLGGEDAPAEPAVDGQPPAPKKKKTTLDKLNDLLGNGN